MRSQEIRLLLLRHFLVCFLPLSLALTGLLTYVYDSQRNNILSDIKARELAKVGRGVAAIDNSFDQATSDLITLAARRNLQELIRQTDSSQADFIEELKLFVRTKKTYDQIRLINSLAQEVLRINDKNGQPQVVMPRELQSKSQRYYMQASVQLKPGQTYVSPLDLNIENGQIQVPYQPTIRFISPIFGDQKNLDGFLAINYNANDLIHEFRLACTGVVSTCTLVNPEGYWVIGPTPDQEWGFIFPDRKNISFAATYPEVWQKIKTQENGQVLTSAGLFTFGVIFPLDESQISSPYNAATPLKFYQYSYTVISQVTPATLDRYLTPLAWNLSITFLLLELLVAAGAMFYARNHLRKTLLALEVAANERKFRFLSETVPVGIFQADAKGVSTYSNQKMLEIYGISQERLAQGEWVKFIHPDDRDAMIASWFDSVKNKAPWQYQFRFVRNGEQRWFVGRGIPVFVDEELTGYVGCYEDLTQAMEQQKYLQQAKGAAEQASRAKSDFLATMSHEIRTPMNAIIGLTGLLLDMELTEQQHEFLNTIRASGDALLSLINDILDFSKIESGKLEIESYPFELRDCVEEALDLMASRANEKGLELAYQMTPEVPSAVTGDMGRLRQILVNLLGNAIKFTQAGEVVLYVHGRALTPSELTNPKCQDPNYPCFEFQFAIRDTGIGIGTEGAKRLFQPFSQVDASTTRQFGGTGLGLAICKRLVEHMGGTIWLESRDIRGEIAKAGVASDLFCSIDIPQTGSVFYFTVVMPISLQAKSAKASSSIASLHGRKVLIVDDSATNRQILTLQTESWQMYPQAFPDAESALAALESGATFDLGILDLHMPGMNGLELGQAIHELEHTKTLPLIMLSSVSQANNLIASQNFAATITKPIKQSALFNVLLRILNESAHTQTQTRAVAPDVSLVELASHLPPLKILLAEDNKVNQMVALRILERLGYRADVAGNGLEVLEALERQPYDVVLMDMQMPEMDGITATQEIIKAWPPEKRPFIIAMTANAMQGDREQCLEAGMDDYVSKPIKVPDLVRALGECPVKTTTVSN